MTFLSIRAKRFLRLWLIAGFLRASLLAERV